MRSLQYDTKKIEKVLSGFREIQKHFAMKYDAEDIISGSKFYEIIIANELNHDIIPGQSGTKDAKDEKGEYELEVINQNTIQIILSHVSYRHDTLMIDLNQEQKTNFQKFKRNK